MNTDGTDSHGFNLWESVLSVDFLARSFYALGMFLSKWNRVPRCDTICANRFHPCQSVSFFSSQD